MTSCVGSIQILVEVGSVVVETTILGVKLPHVHWAVSIRVGGHPKSVADFNHGTFHFTCNCFKKVLVEALHVGVVHGSHGTLERSFLLDSVHVRSLEEVVHAKKCERSD